MNILYTYVHWQWQASITHNYDVTVLLLFAFYRWNGLAWFGWAASHPGAGGMWASSDITDDNPTHISPLSVFPTKHKAILTFAI